MPDTGAAPHAPVMDLFQRLAGDGARWADAEFALARAETGILVRRAAAGVAVALGALVMLIAALVVLAQACVAALAPVTGSAALAGLTVGCAVLAAVAALALLARRLFSAPRPPASFILRWMSGARPGGRSAG